MSETPAIALNKVDFGTALEVVKKSLLDGVSREEKSKLAELYKILAHSLALEADTTSSIRQSKSVDLRGLGEEDLKTIVEEVQGQFRNMGIGSIESLLVKNKFINSLIKYGEHDENSLLAVEEDHYSKEDLSNIVYKFLKVFDSTGNLNSLPRDKEADPLREFFANVNLDIAAILDNANTFHADPLLTFLIYLRNGDTSMIKEDLSLIQGILEFSEQDYKTALAEDSSKQELNRREAIQALQYLYNHVEKGEYKEYVSSRLCLFLIYCSSKN